MFTLSFTNTNNNFDNIIIDDATFRSLLNKTGDTSSNLNCDSLNYMKTVEIRNLICGSRWEVVDFSETWWSSQVSSHSVKIPEYSLCCSNRSTRKGGGVALYISNKLRSSVVDAESLNKVMGNLFVEAEASGVKLLIGIFLFTCRMTISTALNAQSASTKYGGCSQFPPHALWC